jgi:hypothetical protein
MNKKQKNKTLIEKNNVLLIKENGDDQPPKNNVTAKLLINIILPYSPKKNNANPMAEYSTLYPATNSASASGKSNGGLLVSANIDTKKIINNGNKGTTYQIYC